MIYGVGNTLMDITARVSDDFLRENGVEKGMMTLSDLARTDDLLAALRDRGAEVSVSAGGSVANSIAGIAAAGGVDTALFCRVGDDDLGRAFLEETALSGTIVRPDLAVAPGEATSRSVILVTPDGERSMSTYLGASASFGIGNVDEGLVRSSRIGFVEGYLFDTAPGRDAIERLMDLSRAAITLSDPNCVIRNRDAFMTALIRARVVFGNAKEMTALSGTDAEDGVRLCADLGALAVCTRSSRPTLVRCGDRSSEVPVERVENVLDTTGAGDQFAAGFLHSLLTSTAGFGVETAGVEAAEAGARCAALIIQQSGARPPVPENGPGIR